MRKLSYRAWGSVFRQCLIVAVMLLGILPGVKATHYMGGEITYTYVSGNTYTIRQAIYRDCAGVTLGTTSSVNISPSSAGLTVLNLNRISVTDITPLCPGQVSRCVSPAGTVGIEEHIYQGNANLVPFVNPGGFYTLSSSFCCRNNIITTVTSPGSQQMYLSTQLNPNLSPRNNSPVFLNKPIAQFCVNQVANLSPNAFDPDGDAIVYSLTACRDLNATDPVTYAAGFNATNPLSSSTGFTINPSTGVITFTPSAIQVGIICIKAEEFRNGVKIGEIVRDIQVRTINCANNNPPVIAPVANAIVPVNTTFCTPISVTDPNNNALTVTVTGGIIPPATFVITSQGPGFLNGTFCFTPGLVHVGNTYTISINAQDNSCPSPGSAVATFNITVPAVCNVGATSGSTPAACGQSNGTATASMFGGIPPYSYSWSGPGGFTGFTQTITGLAAGVYSVTIVDGNSCVATSSTTVAGGGSTVTVTAAVTNTSCGLNNGSVTATASNGTTPYTYTLNGGSANTTGVFNGLAAGNYVVNVTDANGCGASTTVTVGADPDVTNPTLNCPVSVTLNNDAGVCGAIYSYTVSGADNCGTVTVAQTTGLASGSVFPVGTTTNSFTVVDGSGNTANCSFDVTVVDNEAPAAACQNVTVSLDANGNGSTSAAAVNNGSTDNCGISSISLDNENFTCANAGQANTVVLTVTDVNGNSSTCTATVNVLDEVAPSVVCQDISLNLTGGATATVSAASLIASVSDACGIASSLISQADFSCSDEGANAVTVTVADVNGNSSTCVANVNVVVDPLTATAEVNTYGCGYNVSCNGASDGSASVTVAGGCPAYAYSWSNGATTSGVSGLGAGTYTVTVQDANSHSVVLTVTITEPAALVSTATSGLQGNGTNVSCNSANGSPDGVVTVNTTGGCAPYSYTWSNGGTTQTQSGLGAGTYTVTVQDANGCISTSSVTLTEPDPIDFNMSNCATVIAGWSPSACTTLNAGTTTGGTAPYSFVWSTGATTSSISVCPVNTTTYGVTVTDANGCTASNSVTVNVIDARCGNGNNLNKVLVCHVPPGNPGNAHNICIAAAAVPAHISGSNIGHGTCYVGPCGAIDPCTGLSNGGGNTKQATSGEVSTLKVEAFPNPTSGIINVMITGEINGEAAIQVVDLSGRILESGNAVISGGLYNGTFDLSSFADGMYYVVVLQGENRIVTKVVKE